jgi:hypothetical protein
MSASKSGPVIFSTQIGTGGISLAGLVLAFVLHSHDAPTALVWVIGVGACLPYTWYVFRSILVQNTLFDHLSERMTQHEPFGIGP